jgi:hypothetical protein
LSAALSTCCTQKDSEASRRAVFEATRPARKGQCDDGDCGVNCSVEACLPNTMETLTR